MIYTINYADKDDKQKTTLLLCVLQSITCIQKHYPELTDSIIPVVPPFISHGRFLAYKYGTESKVVFIGPCVAKEKPETADFLRKEKLKKDSFLC